jgi:hypothetical protein
MSSQSNDLTLPLSYKERGYSFLPYEGRVGWGLFISMRAKNKQDYQAVFDMFDLL